MHRAAHSNVRIGASRVLYNIVKFIGVVIVDVKVTGSPKTKEMTIQPMGVADSSAENVGKQ